MKKKSLQKCSKQKPKCPKKKSLIRDTIIIDNETYLGHLLAIQMEVAMPSSVYMIVELQQDTIRYAPMRTALDGCREGEIQIADNTYLSGKGIDPDENEND